MHCHIEASFPAGVSMPSKAASRLAQTMAHFEGSCTPPGHLPRRRVVHSRYAVRDGVIGQIARWDVRDRPAAPLPVQVTTVVFGLHNRAATITSGAVQTHITDPSLVRDTRSEIDRGRNRSAAPTTPLFTLTPQRTPLYWGVRFSICRRSSYFRRFLGFASSRELALRR